MASPTHVDLQVQVEQLRVDILKLGKRFRGVDRRVGDDYIERYIVFPKLGRDLPISEADVHALSA
jgi:hypothetical protein